MNTFKCNGDIFLEKQKLIFKTEFFSLPQILLYNIKKRPYAIVFEYFLFDIRSDNTCKN